MYKLLARDHLGKPAIKGHGGGAVPKNLRLKVLDNPDFAYGSPSYSYFDVTSIENYYQEALDNIYDLDYLFIRDRILELVGQKASATCKGTINDPASVNPVDGDRYCVGDNPVGEFLNKQGAIAEWQGTQWFFLDKEVLGYSLCSLAEKEIAARLDIGWSGDHKNDFDTEKVEQWNKTYHKAATEARFYRIIQAETLINRQLPNQKNIVMASLTSLVVELDLLQTGTPQTYCFDHHKNYKDFGVTGQDDFHPTKNPSPAFGIMDYFYGRTIFTGNGLIDMPWTGETMTLQEISDRIHQILVLGI